MRGTKEYKSVAGKKGGKPSHVVERDGVKISKNDTCQIYYW